MHRYLFFALCQLLRVLHLHRWLLALLVIGGASLPRYVDYVDQDVSLGASLSQPQPDLAAPTPIVVSWPKASLPVRVPTLAPGNPVLVGAGDIATCDEQGDEATAALLDAIPGTVYTLGDAVYHKGTAAEFADCYAPSWGRHRARTRPAAGNHEYHTAGATGYYGYFGILASPQEGRADAPCTRNCLGYYAYDLGSWHIIVLNSQLDLAETSRQFKWLRADLAANPRVCTLAYWHHPRFSSGSHHGGYVELVPLWELLYAHGVDLVLNSHDHHYERFALQDAAGKADPLRGIRAFIVGTGGGKRGTLGAVQSNSEVRGVDIWGVLKLTLHPTSYDWEFVPVAGQMFTDQGDAPCVGAPNPLGQQLFIPFVRHDP